MVERVDVAVIGAGGAGYPGAFQLGRAGRRVLMVDPIGNLGGDCLAEGCVPSKAVREVAQAFQRARRGPLARLIGVRDPDEGADGLVRWREVLAHKDAVQQSRYTQHAGEIAASGVEFVLGVARILDAETIEVETGDGARQVGFGHLVLGTGSAPSRLPIPGAEKAVAPHDFFRLGADLPFPARPVIIGGGYIGVELASMLEHLGAKPVVLELTDQLLPGFDADLATFLGRSLGGRVEVRLRAEVTAIEESGGSLLVHYRTRGAQGAEEFSVSGDQVVMATGRVSVLPDGVEALGLDRDASGAPVVDSRLATSRPSVWAPGDVNRRSMLFHSAIRQSAVVAHNILAGGPADRMNFSGVPFTVFTDPEIASVGLTESDASRKVDEVAIGTYDYATDSRAQIFGETDGYLKLVFDGHTGRLLGAQLAGLDAAQLAAPLALAVHAGLGARQLAESAFPHPMVSEGINKAARSVLS